MKSNAINSGKNTKVGMFCNNSLEFIIENSKYPNVYVSAD
jgi:hypothetical protein